MSGCGRPVGAGGRWCGAHRAAGAQAAGRAASGRDGALALLEAIIGDAPDLPGRAECRGHHALFDLAREPRDARTRRHPHPRALDAARAVCARCPVRVHCRDSLAPLVTADYRRAAG